ncbi:MAG: alpha/beta hydrolase [Myxococcota bacterium]|nr:alpha/beta hydrolase [Myxococcota bacterium]
MRDDSRTAIFCALVALGGCGDGGDADPGPKGDAAGPLVFRDCGKGQCAELTVPLDSRAPEAGTVSIAINRIRANRSPHRGVLFVNPGGPGLPGKDFVEANADALRSLLPGFDLIGFDPRGTGDSQGIHCEAGLDLAGAYLHGKTQAVLDTLEGASKRCAESQRPLFDHLGTNRVVDDIELVRQALGSEELNFLGISYGTRLAVEYARKYPERARAVVLDAAVPPSGDFIELVEGQFEALLEMHQKFFEACSEGVFDCPPEPQRVFDEYVAGLEPAQAAGFIRAWQSLLTTAFGPAILAEALRSGFTGPSVDGMPGMLPGADIDALVNLAIHCTDSTRAPFTPAEAEAEMAYFEAQSPTFASLGLLSLSCVVLPVARDPIATGAFTPRIAPLIIGGTADILTPYAWAEESALALRGASLLTSEHFGHSAMSFGSRCVFDEVRDFLIDPKPLPAGATCPSP